MAVHVRYKVRKNFFVFRSSQTSLWQLVVSSELSANQKPLVKRNLMHKTCKSTDATFFMWASSNDYLCNGANSGKVCLSIWSVNSVRLNGVHWTAFQHVWLNRWKDDRKFHNWNGSTWQFREREIRMSLSGLTFAEHLNFRFWSHVSFNSLFDWTNWINRLTIWKCLTNACFSLGKHSPEEIGTLTFSRIVDSKFSSRKVFNWTTQCFKRKSKRSLWSRFDRLRNFSWKWTPIIRFDSLDRKPSSRTCLNFWLIRFRLLSGRTHQFACTLLSDYRMPECL